MVQDHKLDFDEIKFGDFFVAMRSMLRPYDGLSFHTSSSTSVEYYLTPSQIEQTQNEVASVLNTVLQNIINDTEISWALDDAVDIFMTTGIEIIRGNLKQFLM